MEYSGTEFHLLANLIKRASSVRITQVYKSFDDSLERDQFELPMKHLEATPLITRELKNKNPVRRGLEPYNDQAVASDGSTSVSWFQKAFTTSWTKEYNSIVRKIKKGSPAKKLVFSAANKLIEKGLKRDAIRLLYEFKFYREAADILRASGSAIDAARLYVKAKRWDLAEHCFNLQQDRLNAARCAQAAGKYEKAATVFKEFQEWSSAARCYRRIGSWRQAAHYFGVAGFKIDAVRCWHEWTQLDQTKTSIRTSAGPILTAEELHQIVYLMSDGYVEPILMAILDQHAWTGILVIDLVKRDKLSVAAEIYETRFAEISQTVCAGARTNPEIADSILTLCQMVNDRRGADELLGNKSLTNSFNGSSTGSFALDSSKAARDPIPPPFRASEATSILENSNALMSAPKAISFESKLFTLNTGSKDISPAFVVSRFFNKLGSEDRHKLWDIGGIVSYKAGDTIVDAGSNPACTFTVLDGEVDIYRQENHFERLADRLTSGQNIGESWLLVNLQAQVRVVAATDCHLHVIKKQQLDQLSSKVSPQSARIVTHLAQLVCSHLLGSFGVGRATKRPA